jgi:hypothetical protein
MIMSKKRKKEKDILKLCMKYQVCKLCPRNKKCEKELRMEDYKK